MVNIMEIIVPRESVGHRPVQASAPWIWNAENGPGDTWMCFRHQVALDKVPDKVPAILAADSLYWLWINGAAVIEAGGLKRGPTPTDTYADQMDLAPFLRPGLNQIAVLVWYYGISGSSHIDSGNGGFLLETPIADLRTSARWRVSPHAAFQSRPAGAKAWHPVGDKKTREKTLPPPPLARDTLSESPIHFDARLDRVHWREEEPPSDWNTATEKGIPPVLPWGKLIPRPIHFFRIGKPQRYLNHDQLVISRQGPAILIGKLPNNIQVFSRLHVRAEAGREILIHTERGYKGTTYITREGEQSFEVPAWSNGHSVTYTIPAGVQVLDLEYRETGIDTDFKGEFSCSDPRLNTLWTKCGRSIYVNMHDSYMDCPDRERSQWPFDMTFTAAATYYLFDRRVDTLFEKGIREFLGWRTPSGILWGAVPSGRFIGKYREFPVQNLHYIAVGVPTHLEQTGNLALAADIVPPIRRYLLECWSMNADGLPRPRPTETDWGPGTAKWMDWGAGTIDRTLLEVAWYGWAVSSIDRIRAMAGLPEDLAISERRKSIAAAFDRVFWDESVQAYRAHGYKDPPDDRGNAIAVCAGLAASQRTDALAAMFAKTERSSIGMERYVIEAMFTLDHALAGLQRLKRRFAKEISSQYTTLPEGFGSDSNHGWGAWPAAFMVERIAGIRPITPGYGTFVVDPRPAGLSQFSVRFPSIRGEIAVAWNETADAANLRVECPENTNATVVFPKTSTKTRLSAPGAIPDPQNPCRFSIGAGIWNFEAR